MIPQAHPSSQPKRHLNRFRRFAPLTVQFPYTFQWDALPLKIASSHGGYGLPSNTCFLAPIRILNNKGSSISSAVFAGLTTTTTTAVLLLLVLQTDRQTLLGL